MFNNTKNENITSFGGIYHIMDVFSKLGFEKLTESVLSKRGSSGKAFNHESIFGSLFFSYLCGGGYLKDIKDLPFHRLEQVGHHLGSLEFLFVEHPEDLCWLR